MECNELNWRMDTHDLQTNVQMNILQEAQVIGGVFDAFAWQGYQAREGGNMHSQQSKFLM